MQYLLMIYEDESLRAQRTPEDMQAILAGYTTFTKELQEAGKMIAGDALEGVSTATTVRVRDGKTMTVDGPFAETKEQLGGYYLVEADDLDDALAIAAKIPTAQHGSIEVRPIMIWDEPPLSER